jgi:hypothetical protein
MSLVQNVSDDNVFLFKLSLMNMSLFKLSLIYMILLNSFLMAKYPQGKCSCSSYSLDEYGPITVHVLDE